MRFARLRRPGRCLRARRPAFPDRSGNDSRTSPGARDGPRVLEVGCGGGRDARRWRSGACGCGVRTSPRLRRPVPRPGTRRRPFRPTVRRPAVHADGPYDDVWANASPAARRPGRPSHRAPRLAGATRRRCSGLSVKEGDGECGRPTARRQLRATSSFGGGPLATSLVLQVGRRRDRASAGLHGESWLVVSASGRHEAHRVLVPDGPRARAVVSRSWAEPFVIGELDGGPPPRARRGHPPKQVWASVWKALELPEDRAQTPYGTVTGPRTPFRLRFTLASVAG